MFCPGGPAAHIGLFEKIFCQQLKWLPQHVFLELFALAQRLPGPASTQVLCTCRPVQYADCVSQDEQLRSRHDARADVKQNLVSFGDWWHGTTNTKPH